MVWWVGGNKIKKREEYKGRGKKKIKKHEYKMEFGKLFIPPRTPRSFECVRGVGVAAAGTGDGSASLRRGGGFRSEPYAAKRPTSSSSSSPPAEYYATVYLIPISYSGTRKKIKRYARSRCRRTRFPSVRLFFCARVVINSRRAVAC